MFRNNSQVRINMVWNILAFKCIVGGKKRKEKEKRSHHTDKILREQMMTNNINTVILFLNIGFLVYFFVCESVHSQDCVASVWPSYNPG